MDRVIADWLTIEAVLVAACVGSERTNTGQTNYTKSFSWIFSSSAVAWETYTLQVYAEAITSEKHILEYLAVDSYS